MTSDALFGPDGTQLPEPQAVLPDPLVGPGTTAASDRYGPAVPPMSSMPSVPSVPLPPGLDPEAMREAIRAALGDEPTARQPAPRPPVPTPPAQPAEPPIESLQTPPSGIPVQPGYRPPPPSAARGPGPPPQRPGVPTAAQRRAAIQRAHETATDHLTAPRRGPSGGGWIGCVVLLIFIAVIVYNLVSALVDTFTGG